MSKLSTVILFFTGLLISSSLYAATPLVDVAWIKGNSCNSDVRVLDIRNPLDGGSRTDYLKGHIPCAVYTDYLKGGWRAGVDKVPGQLPPTDKIAKLIGESDNTSFETAVNTRINSLATSATTDELVKLAETIGFVTDTTTSSALLDLSAIQQNLVPDTTDIRNLGSASKQWDNLYLNAGTIQTTPGNSQKQI